MADELDDEELRMALQRIARRIRNNRGDDSIGDSQMGVLFRLDRIGDTSPGVLAEHEHVTPPSINRTLNGLEERGLVRRSPSPDDARKVSVSLTDAGRALLAETRRLRTAWFSRRIADLDPDDRALLAAAMPVLQKLSDE
jgi:DNA-binding MarR family transcriptional regulator